MAKSSEYHGNLLDTEFVDSDFVGKFKIFAKKKSSSNPWTMHGVAVPADKIEETIKDVQKNLINGPYYAHFYKDDELIVVFKHKIFRVKTDKKTWKEIMQYGLKLNIPEEQLDFAPVRFKDEEDYYR